MACELVQSPLFQTVALVRRQAAHRQMNIQTNVVQPIWLQSR